MDAPHVQYTTSDNVSIAWAEAIPAPQEGAALPVCNVWEIRGGKMFSNRQYYDPSVMMQQLGVVAGAAGASWADREVRWRAYDRGKEWTYGYIELRCSAGSVDVSMADAGAQPERGHRRRERDVAQREDHRRGHRLHGPARADQARLRPARAGRAALAHRQVPCGRAGKPRDRHVLPVLRARGGLLRAHRGAGAAAHAALLFQRLRAIERRLRPAARGPRAGDGR